MIRCEALYWGAPGQPLTPALDFELPKGSLTAVIGANGSGKSSLLKVLAGLQKPLTGKREQRTLMALSGRELQRAPRARSSLAEVHLLIVTSHDAFGYPGQAYGIDFMAPRGLSTEREPRRRSGCADHPVRGVEHTMIHEHPSGDLPLIAESAYVDKTAIICGKVVIGKECFRHSVSITRVSGQVAWRDKSLNDNCQGLALRFMRYHSRAPT